MKDTEIYFTIDAIEIDSLFADVTKTVITTDKGGINESGG